jgi:hypothetical protein
MWDPAVFRGSAQTDDHSLPPNTSQVQTRFDGGLSPFSEVRECPPFWRRTGSNGSEAEIVDEDTQ